MELSGSRRFNFEDAQQCVRAYCRAVRQSGGVCGLGVGWVSATSTTHLFVDIETVKINTAKSAMTRGGLRRGVDGI